MEIEEYKKLKEHIEELDDKCDVLIQEFDSYWFGANLNIAAPNDMLKNFEEYNKQKDAACGDALIELRKLSIVERMNRPIELSELPTYGDVMSLKKFIGCCKGGGFINYDGYGHYVKDNQETNIEIYPSDIKKGNIRKEFDTIIWYNR